MRVVITADDLGYASCRDAGIFDCVRSGTVGAVSLLVTGASAVSAVRAAQAIPSLSLGLHLNLTEGAPAAPIASVGSLLVPSTGSMHGKEGFRLALAAGTVSLAEVRAEVRAQLAAFARLTGGAAPAHVDGHQHVHVLPGVCTIFAEEVAAAGARWVRVPALSAAEDTQLPHTRAAFYRGVAADCAAARAVFAAHGLRSSTAFAGYALGGSICSVAALVGACRAAFAAKAATGAEAGGCGDPDLEIMLHPGIPVSPDATADEAGCGSAPADDFAQSLDRGAELAVLTSATLRAELAAVGVTLCGWAAAHAQA